MVIRETEFKKPEAPPPEKPAEVPLKEILEQQAKQAQDELVDFKTQKLPEDLDYETSADIIKLHQKADKAYDKFVKALEAPAKYSLQALEETLPETLTQEQLMELEKLKAQSLETVGEIISEEEKEKKGELQVIDNRITHLYNLLLKKEKGEAITESEIEDMRIRFISELNRVLTRHGRGDVQYSGETIDKLNTVKRILKGNKTQIRQNLALMAEKEEREKEERKERAA